jgi:hypothetical protein
MSGFDFRKMAADAKAAMEERKGERQPAPNKVKAERENYVSLAAKPLIDGILPQLEKASKDFAEEEIHSSITTVLGSEGHAEQDPMVKFQCKGPPGRDGGAVFEARPIFFTSNGSRIRLGVGDHRFSRKADRIIAEDRTGNIESLVRIGLERAIEFYMEEFEKHQAKNGK